MNFIMVKQLILKDWYLQRWTILGALALGAVALGIIATGGNAAFMLGLILLVSVIIAFGAILAMSTMVEERKQQTLAFVMSLPISHGEYTAAKILANLLIYLAGWLTLVLGSIAILVISPKSQGLIPFTVIMAVEMLMSTIMTIAVALITESQGWTIAAIMVGNIAFNVIGYFVAHIPAIANGMEGHAIHWSPPASFLLLAEFSAIVSVLGLAFFFQARKKDFL